MDINNVVVIALTVGIVEMIKQIGIDKKIVPLVSLVVAILLTFIAKDMLEVVTWQEVVLSGLISGLSACGLYSGSKTIIEK